MRIPIAERFWSKVQKTDTCWLWTAAKNPNGYGLIGAEVGKRGSVVKAHRASWVLANGAIPDGLHVLHKCDTPACVNPDHLFLGTHKDNVVDMHAKGRGYCGGNGEGEQSPNSVLTADQVLEIRRLAAQGSSRKELADKFGVVKSTISQIVRRKTWRSIA